MDFRTFEARAHAMWDEIPDAFKAGVDGVVVRREIHTHSDHPDYFTLGMCFTEPYPSGFSGPDTTRSILALYWGSFRAIAKRGEAASDDAEFNWEEELWETITHELRHHLEFLADEDALEGVDYAMEETYKRSEGEPFDPWYWQHGLPLAPGVFRVEYDVYLEQQWRDDAFLDADRLTFEWDGGRWELPRPDALGDVHFIWVEGVETAGGALEVVLVRARPVGERLGRWVKRAFGALKAQGAEEMVYFESEAQAIRVGDAPASAGPLDGRPGRAAGGPPPPPSP